MDEHLDPTEALLMEAEGCLADGDPEGALHAADEILGGQARHAGACYLRALALRELERADDALASLDVALAEDPDFADAAYARAELLTFDLDEPELALDICDHFLRQDLEDTLYADFLNLKGNALCETADFKGALGCFDRAAELEPDGEDIGSRGWALFELGRIREAADALRTAAQPGPLANPANHFYLAVALARLAEPRAAAKHFRIAARSDPDMYHVPRPFPADELAEALEEAAATLPRALAAGLVGVPRRVEPWPAEEELQRTPGAMSPLCLVRVVTDGPTDGTESPPPAAALLLYSDNASFVARDRESLVEELRPALWEELVRHLGLDRDEVEEAGLH